MSSDSRQTQVAEWLRDLFNLDATRLVLSALILISVLPWTIDLSALFLVIFAAELACRLQVLAHDHKQRGVNRVELLFFALDVLATLSFLPVQVIWNDIRFLRLFRLSRMLLLIGYWGPTVREIWVILMKRERRYQVLFVGASVLLLTFLSAIILFHFRRNATDSSAEFWSILWWSFRQVQDPGNMDEQAHATMRFFFSVFLTVSGLFLFSFLVGIASSVVEELVRVGRERRIGMRNHSVLCNLGDHNRVLLEELVTYYKKALRAPKIVTMGAAATRYRYMYEAQLRPVRYRQGEVLSSHDLAKVDADRATRVLLLGRTDHEASDSEVVSQVLSVREVNDGCTIYAELFREDNVRAALQAGGARTVPILANQLVSCYLARIVMSPGVEAVYRELLSSQGDEIYTCVFGHGLLANRQPPSGKLLPFQTLLERGHRAHGVVLLGYLIDDDTTPTGFRQLLSSRLTEPAHDDGFPAVDQLRGFFGVATNFSGMRAFVESLPDVAAPLREGAAHGRTEAVPPWTPRLGQCPVARHHERLLIAGFHDGLIDFCEQLILHNNAPPELFVAVPSAAGVARAVAAFCARAADSARSRPHEEPHVRFVADEAPTATTGDDGRTSRIRYSSDGECAHRGAIVVFEGDWNIEHTMLSFPEAGYQLKDMDAAVLTYTPEEGDPDARTALGLLKLIRLRDRRDGTTKATLRIVCEVRHTEKAALLQRRFSSGPEGALESLSQPGFTCHGVTIVAAESMRNALIAQAVFVPGIAMIYRELLRDGGAEVCKLLVLDRVRSSAPVTFGELLVALYQRDRALLLAVELDDGSGRRTVVNPRPRSADYQFAAESLHAVLVIAPPHRFTAAAAPCDHCACDMNRAPGAAHGKASA